MTDPSTQPPNQPPPQIYYVPVPQGPRTSGKAIAVMVLGIVSLAMICSYGLGLIPAIVALSLSPSAKREIESSQGQVVGRGQLKAGVICAWVTVGVVVTIIAVGLIVWAVSSASRR